MASSSSSPSSKDPEERRRWLVLRLKDLSGTLIYSLLFLGFTGACEPVPRKTLLSLHQGPLSLKTRGILIAPIALLCAGIAIVDIIFSPKPRPGDRKWHLLHDGLVGHFAYLTVNTVVSQAIYWVASFAAERSWLWLIANPENDSIWARKLIASTYTLSIFSSSLGALLTLGFLKFIWFEPTWRKEVLKLHEERGNVWFTLGVLFTHVPQLVVSFLDLILLKNRELLSFLVPSTKMVLLVSCGFFSGYMLLLDVNYRANGGHYPYPVLNKLLTSKQSTLKVLGGVVSFYFGLSMIFRTLVTGVPV